MDECLNEAAIDLIVDMHLNSDREDAKFPQIVVSFDPMTKCWEAYGPYPDRESALIAMDALDASFNTPESNDGIPAYYGIAPLRPPV
jgi:hypothetical protein